MNPREGLDARWIEGQRISIPNALCVLAPLPLRPWRQLSCCLPRAEVGMLGAKAPGRLQQPHGIRLEQMAPDLERFATEVAPRIKAAV